VSEISNSNSVRQAKERVVSIVEEGDSAREAARLLNLGASTAIRWIERWTTTGSVEAKPGTGLVEEGATMAIAKSNMISIV
jgi:transposase